MEKIIEEIFKMFSISALRYFVLAGIPFALFYMMMPSKLGRFKIQQKQASKKDFLREVWHSMQSNLVFTVIAVAILFTPLKQYTRIYDHISDFPAWYLGFSVVLCLIIHDTYFYWMHRLLHHKKLFKLTHVVHHQSTNPSPWTSYSFHLAEAVTEGAILLVIAFLIPVHPLAIVLFTISAFIINVYGHLGYEITPKWFRHTLAFEVFNTSVHHNLHHSKFKGNYGLYFRIWDRIMGTEHPDYVKEYDKLQQQRFGEAPSEGSLVAVKSK
ncbi:sterol desaturase family protein [Pedobacter sp. MC2016-24]|uniref:sterol desaturase family protein n=1 Tax=Pedobacter sp. MC2016-24 TaxID=2780090 RepID=UPI00187E581B|nr:sterol desaturase family protein [Pedobacter sp. MC2016-24]MBE9601854.1 sterol desaturase family protein [Pedobacter sp. MC2016-24]